MRTRVSGSRSTQAARPRLAAPLALSLLLIPGLQGVGQAQARFYEHYERGVGLMKSGNPSAAESELRAALEEADSDTHVKRTYGMRFIKYFPHRELGVVYYETGDRANAIHELQTSLSQAWSERAADYLRRSQLNGVGTPLQQPPVQEPSRPVTPPAAGSDRPASVGAVEGSVIGEDAGEVYLDLGTADGIRIGTKCIVFREGEAIVNSSTDEVVGRKVVNLGVLVVTEVRRTFSVARLTSGPGGIRKGDRIIVR